MLIKYHFYCCYFKLLLVLFFFLVVRAVIAFLIDCSLKAMSTEFCDVNYQF